MAEKHLFAEYSRIDAIDRSLYNIIDILKSRTKNTNENPPHI